MRILHSILLLACSITLSAQKVSGVYDGDYDFSGAKTYTWSKATQLKMEKFINIPYASKEIIKYFKEYGYTLKEEGKADLIVDLDVKQTMEKTPMSVDRNLTARSYPRPRQAAGSVSVNAPSVNKIGNFTLKLINPENNDAVWMATASDDLEGYDDVEKRQKRTKKIIKKMFRKFPGERVEG